MNKEKNLYLFSSVLDIWCIFLINIFLTRKRSANSILIYVITNIYLTCFFFNFNKLILTVILSSKSIRIKLFLSNSDLCFAKMHVSRNLLLYSVSLIFSGFACIYSGLTPFSFWWRHKLVLSILILQRRCDFLISENTCKYMGAISTFLRRFAWYFLDKKHQFLISILTHIFYNKYRNFILMTRNNVDLLKLNSWYQCTTLIIENEYLIFKKHDPYFRISENQFFISENKTFIIKKGSN